MSPSPCPGLESCEPVLPPELEKRIFEIAYNPTMESANSLMILTAHRVRSWLRPLRFHICIQLDSRRFPKFENIPASVSIDEIASFIKFCIVTDFSDPNSELGSVLKKCNNLESLVCDPDSYSTGPCMGKTLISMSNFCSLRRLSAKLEDLNLEEDLLASAFQSLTHIELAYAEPTWPFHALRSLKQLTHVMIYGGEVAQVHNVPILSKISGFVENLKVFIFCTSFGGGLLDVDVKFYSEDPRRVIFSAEMNTLRNILKAARGLQPDIWLQAENIVTARQKHYFKSDEYLKYPVSSLSDWHHCLSDEGKEWARSVTWGYWDD